ncbi:hypothetical protein NYY93_26185, partial [Acinetobacter baumannii]|nr:hypothetical protein [Acinetobacter baumannii]
YVIWNTILIGFISTGIIKINQTLSPIANLTIFLAVGIMSFILLIGVASHAHQLKNENKMNFRSNKLKNT